MVAVAAFIVSLLALAVSGAATFAAWRSMTFEKQSATAATRSADAAETANRLTERALLQGVPAIVREPNDVQFALSKGQGSTWMLRNTGTEVAEHVRVEPIKAPHRGFPTGAVIKPGEGIDLLMTGTWQTPIPNQLYVSWAGQEPPVSIPVVQ
jgi:hypothetical protein